MADTPNDQSRSISNLESAMASFCPSILLSNFQHHPTRSHCIQSKYIKAACLLADISGFSKLSGELCQRGAEGLDELHQATSGFLSEFMNIIYSFGGDVIFFAGDAVVCLFQQTTTEMNDNNAFSCCERSINCGYILKDMQTDKLKAHIAISFGDMQFTILGGFEEQWIYLLNGSCIFELGKCIDNAEPQQLVVTKELYDLANDYMSSVLHESISEWIEGVMLSSQDSVLIASNRRARLLYQGQDRGTETPITVGERYTQALSYVGKASLESQVDLLSTTFSTVSAISFEDSKDSKESATGMIDKLKGFLPAPVTAYLHDDLSEVTNELREVTTVFVKLDSLSMPSSDGDSNADMTNIQPLFYDVQILLHKYGGFLRQFVIDDKGCVIIALWGVVSSSYADKSVRAMLFAIQLQKLLGLVYHQQISIGVTTGRVYCGTVGSSLRRDYAAVGASVNLSARLMGKAKGRILVDEYTYQSLPDVLKNKMVTAESMMLKGYSTPHSPFTLNVGYFNMESLEEDDDDYLLLGKISQGTLDPRIYSTMMDAISRATRDVVSLLDKQIKTPKRNVLRAVSCYHFGEVGSSQDQLDDRIIRQSQSMNEEAISSGSGSGIKNFRSILMQSHKSGNLAAIVQKTVLEEQLSSLRQEFDIDSDTESVAEEPMLRCIIIEGDRDVGKTESAKRFDMIAKANRFQSYFITGTEDDEYMEYGVIRKVLLSLIGYQNFSTEEKQRAFIGNALLHIFPLTSKDDIIRYEFPLVKRILGLQWVLSKSDMGSNWQRIRISLQECGLANVAAVEKNISATSSSLDFVSFEHSWGVWDNGWDDTESADVTFIASFFSWLVSRSNRPSVVIIDDAHFCDPLSWEQLCLLLSLERPVIIMLTVKHTINFFASSKSSTDRRKWNMLLKMSKELGLNNVTKVILEDMCCDQIRVVLEQSLLVGDRLDDENKQALPLNSYSLNNLAAKVEQVTGGNPYWVNYIAGYIKNNGVGTFMSTVGEQIPTKDKMEVPKTKLARRSLTPTATSAPYSPKFSSNVENSLLQSHILSSIDTKLNSIEQSILKHASIIGEKFCFQDIADILPKKLHKNIHDALRKCVHERFIYIVKGHQSGNQRQKNARFRSTAFDVYNFSNYTIYIVMLKLIPPSELKRLHLSTAIALEQRLCDGDPLMNHFDMYVWTIALALYVSHTGTLIVSCRELTKLLLLLYCIQKFIFHFSQSDTASAEYIALKRAAFNCCLQLALQSLSLLDYEHMLQILRFIEELCPDIQSMLHVVKLLNAGISALNKKHFSTSQSKNQIEISSSIKSMVYNNNNNYRRIDSTQMANYIKSNEISEEELVSLRNEYEDYVAHLLSQCGEAKLDEEGNGSATELEAELGDVHGNMIGSKPPTTCCTIA